MSELYALFDGLTIEDENALFRANKVANSFLDRLLKLQPVSEAELCELARTVGQHDEAFSRRSPYELESIEALMAARPDFASMVDAAAPKTNKVLAPFNEDSRKLRRDTLVNFATECGVAATLVLAKTLFCEVLLLPSEFRGASPAIECAAALLGTYDKQIASLVNHRRAKFGPAFSEVRKIDEFQTALRHCAPECAMAFQRETYIDQSFARKNLGQSGVEIS